MVSTNFSFNKIHNDLNEICFEQYVEGIVNKNFKLIKFVYFSKNLIRSIICSSHFRQLFFQTLRLVKSSL